jgi:hypothetical protein
MNTETALLFMAALFAMACFVGIYFANRARDAERQLPKRDGKGRFVRRS